MGEVQSSSLITTTTEKFVLEPHAWVDGLLKGFLPVAVADQPLCGSTEPD